MFCRVIPRFLNNGAVVSISALQEALGKRMVVRSAVRYAKLTFERSVTHVCKSKEICQIIIRLLGVSFANSNETSVYKICDFHF